MDSSEIVATRPFILNKMISISQAPWNSRVETSVKTLGEKANGYKIMHVQSARRSARTYDILMYMGIICGPVAGVLSGVGAALHPSEENLFPIIASIVAMISSIFIASVKFGNFEEQSVAHKQAAASYTSLESNVRRQLALSRTSRIDVETYLEYIGTSYDNLFRASPLIPKNIYTVYSEDAKRLGMNVPDEYGLTVRVDPMYAKAYNEDPVKSSSIDVNIHAQNESNLEIIAEEHEKSVMMKRNANMASLPALSKYSDGQMEYEMRRMMVFSDNT
jgi:hypothetical protein